MTELKLKSDDEILEEIFALLSERVKGNPYGDDGSYAEVIAQLPLGLRATAATHHLDVSLTMDSLGWHFLNFGEVNFVRATHAGLQELGLNDLAGWFLEAYEIVDPLKKEMREADEFDGVLQKHGRLERLDALNKLAWNMDEGAHRKVSGSAIYGAWVEYARLHPERIFV